MVQPGQDWHGYDSAGSLDGSGQGGVLAQSQMRARLVVVNAVRREDPPQMLFAKDQHMVQTLAPQRPDQALHVRVLPGRSRRYRPIPNAHRPQPVGEDLPITAIIVSN